MVNQVYIDTPILGKDIKLALQGSRAGEIQKALESRPKMLGRVKSYEYSGPSVFRSVGKSRFTPPIYDLSEIARAADIEPYISQSIRKHREQILKEGYIISGTDDALVTYVRQRLFEIAMMTGITTETWVRELVTNLVAYHNAYLIFRRDKKRSTGKRIMMFGRDLDPIAGIFVGDPVSMEVEVDKYGTPKKWRQKVETGEAGETIDKEYNVHDVVHISVDRKTGFTYGTPYLMPVLDDIRALRKLEEVALIVASKEAFPLYHYKVGTEDRPAITYEGGSNEVDAVVNEVASLPAQGYVVTSERHEIKLISRDGSALDLSPYLAYFESRVIAGLRLSPLDLGRGGALSRGTATNINKSLQDSAKDYQQVISDIITHFVVVPLLLEGGYDVYEENIARFTFPTIDREEERASQNHGLQLYMGNAISATEFRKTYLNRQPMSDEDVADCMLTKQTEAQKDIARTTASARATSSSGSDLGIKSVINQISNKGQPKNQSGTKPAKSRFKANDYCEKVADKFSVCKSNILSSLSTLEDTGALEDIIREFVKGAVEASKEYIDEAIEEGYTTAKTKYLNMYPDEDIDFEEIGDRAKDRFYMNFVNKSYWKQITPYKNQIIDSLKKDVDGNINVTSVVSLLSVLDSTIKILIRDQLVTAERFGFIKFAKKIGSKTIDLVNPDNQETESLDISKLIYKNFIPTSSNINHYLSFPKSS